MKKIFSYIGMFSLVFFSFFISDKTSTVVKDVDEIMIEIKEKKETYNKEPINAIINENTIIPGIYGKKINEKKSYEKMKKIGVYNENYLVFDEIKPETSSEKQYDKYIISGNRAKNTISLIFIVKGNDNIDKIIQILEKNQVKATFFIDGYWFKKNNDLITNLIDKGHTIGNLSYNLDYEDTGFIWINNILKKIGKQEINYCYKTDKKENINACVLQKNYTVDPNIKIKEDPLIEIKQQIKPGSLIELNINEKLNNELELVINYIKSKGYKIENIDTHLSEKNNN